MALLKAAVVGTLGAGVVLLICRFALLPFSPDFKWVQYLGIAMVVVAGMGLRKIHDEASTVWLAAGGALGAAIAFAVFLVFIKPTPAADVSLVEREFPGVIVHVPADQPVLDQTSMANGRWKIDRIGGSRGVLEVGWQPGRTEIAPEQMVDLMKAAGGGKIGTVESETTVVATHRGTALTAPLNDTAIYLSTWYCEQHDRDFTLTTMILESRARGKEFHERIADGIQCHVGDKPMIEISKPLVSIPPSYGYMPDSDPPAFMNLDGDELAIQHAPSEVARQIDAQPGLILKMFELAPEVTNARLDGQVRALARDSSQRVVTRVQYEEEGQDVLASVTTIDCGKNPSFFVMHSYSAGGQSAAEDVLLTAVCHDGGEAQIHATVQEVFSEACASKDGRGCYMMASMETASDSPRQSEVKGFLERGCEYGNPGSCNDLGVLVQEDDAAADAQALFKRACELGSSLGCENAGLAKE